MEEDRKRRDQTLPKMSVASSPHPMHDVPNWDREPSIRAFQLLILLSRPK